MALGALAAWCRAPSPWWLAVAAASISAAAVLERRGGTVRAVGAALVLATVLAGFTAHGRARALTADWGGYWEAREAEVFGRLTSSLEGLVARGEAAVDALAAVADEGVASHARVAALRREHDFPAAAVYDARGDLAVWDGTHRGRVPEAVQLGGDRYAYGEVPLFSYLYFTAPVPSTGGTAVVAALVRTDLPETLGADPGDFVSRFAEDTGERIRVTVAERSPDQAVYDFGWNDRTLFSVYVEPPAQAARLDRVWTDWIRAVVVLWVLAWLLLAVGRRGDRPNLVAAATTLMVGASLLPFGRVLGEDAFFRAIWFVLPGPGEVSVGRLLALGLAGAVLVGLFPARGRLHPAAAGALVAVSFPLAVAWVVAGASPTLLAGTEPGWIAFQLALAAVLALAAGVAVTAVRSEGTSARPLRILAAVAAALVLMAVGGAWVRLAAHVPSVLAAAWGVPAALAAWALRGWAGWRRAVVGWAVATVVGASAALPFAWDAMVGARMRVAEEQLGRLGSQVDPYLAFLLRRLAATVDSVDAAGAAPVEVLYRGWTDSGLAEEGYPVWLTLWSGSIPQEELRFGVGSRPRPPEADDDLEAPGEPGTVRVRRYETADVHYAVQAVLGRGRILTGVVPPLREVRVSSPLGPLFGSLSNAAPDPLTLVPLRVGDRPTLGDSVRWIRIADGWEGERALSYPDATYYAHYAVPLGNPLLSAARAALLLTLDALFLVLAWSLGRLLRRARRPMGPGWRTLFSSFRARVTLALFSFFLLSNAIFGTLAYRTIAGASVRATQVLSERIAEDAGGFYQEEGGQMELLSDRVRAELLEYRGGELREGSVEELMELGLYEGWVPYPVWEALAGLERLEETATTSVGRWEYVTTYRRLPDGDMVAAPVPLQAGATAVRREEVLHLLAFTVLAGGLLSLALALLVGRTLTHPMQTLQVASERVGSGNLGVRLPGSRSDEFGAVFDAFNRMVRRLRRARRDLVRTTQRTRAIVEDAAAGVIALDHSGGVTLVNPRAIELVGRPIEEGSPLPAGPGPGEDLFEWVRLYYRDGLREAASEFQLGDRRVRVRARRITREGPLGGVVVAMEDVTDELRTERVLAWGEMARQVAHEVKNPLTPIKLSIQHIRRARVDRRPDFDAILDRNAEAMLREIDRLAAIASSFSRFGAPAAAGEVPLQEVEAGRVVDEVLALYDTGEGPIRFAARVPGDLPPVRAREAEVKEVLINLLENARAAIPRRGSVTIEGHRSGGRVLLVVRDDGTGIAPELVPRIFEPHFSTRSTGTGLGLAIVQRLVESWDGAVTVESEPGSGTEVQLWLQPWNGTGVEPPDPSP